MFSTAQIEISGDVEAVHTQVLENLATTKKRALK